MSDESFDRLFPVLTPAQLTRVARCGHERAFAAGDVLIEHGAVQPPCFVVLDGAIEATVPTRDGVRLIQVLRRGAFTGEVGIITQRHSLATIRAIEVGRALEIPHDDLVRLLATDAEIGELFLRVFILRRTSLIAGGLSDLVLVGSRYSAETLRLQEFLTRNGHPYTYLDVDRDPAVQELLDRLHVGVDEVPIVIDADDAVYKRPTVAALAECLGMSTIDTARVHDLVVVGAGPAGLATAVYAASEGLDTIVVESEAPGGQAGTSSRIENYLGFPMGISGQDLAARAATQAIKFGAEISVARIATELGCTDAPYQVSLGDGVVVRTRAVVIATGAAYRRLAVPGIERYEGAGVYYAATEMEANLCQRDDVAVVGGGNSAGQAAVFLSRSARTIHMLVRGPGLADSMSRYLIQRIEETPNIHLRTQVSVEEIHGDGRVERLVCGERGKDDRFPLDVRHVFVMTGADPATAWLGGCVELDGNGFVRTGLDLTPEELAAAGWPLARQPLQFETSRPRVFAVGDVRAGSVKRVAAAVGEGSACVQLVHRVLAE